MYFKCVTVVQVNQVLARTDDGGSNWELVLFDVMHRSKE